MRSLRRPWLLSLAWLAWSGAAADTPPQLVASTPPIHSLVAAVSGERTEPHLLVPGGQSPHSFSLAPSDARALSRAHAVFTAGGTADDFLERPLATLAGDARVRRMAEVEGARRLPARRGGDWAASEASHGHGEHGDEHDGAHAPESTDPHVWLDARNAIAYTRAIASTLTTLDPGHAAGYRSRAARQVERLRALDRRLRERLAPVASRRYLVFHDAYQYFEARYDLAAAGSIAIDPERPPGARRIGELRTRIERGNITCLFTEPQFEPRIARVIAADTKVRLAALDPLGADLEPGAGLYPALLERLADALRDCLGDARVG